MTVQPPKEAEREAFEADAEPMGFDLTRFKCAAPEPWSEYADSDTWHRWGGWLARAALPAEPARVLTVEAVATMGRDGELDWLIEGGPGALEPGEVLMICAERLTDDTGSGEVYRIEAATQGAKA